MIGFNLIETFRSISVQAGTTMAWWVTAILFVTILLSLLNFLIFFLSTRNFRRMSPKEVHRRHVYRAQTAQPRRGAKISKHKCAICGRTELDDPNLTFRFCSKCEGNYEYCQDHLFTHEHIRRSWASGAADCECLLYLVYWYVNALGEMQRMGAGDEI